MLNQYYPTPSKVDKWCQDLVTVSEEASLYTETLAGTAPWPIASLGVRHHEGNLFVKFTTDGEESFYGFWQPVFGGGPAPLLLHLPGYGAEMSAHPELATAGYNVLHINPLGYATPEGFDESKRSESEWPVLPDTVATFGKHGYRDFLRHALLAIRWAKAQPCVQANRLGVFGSSQGGGTALLIASLLKDHGIKAVAADVPYLTNFPLMHAKGESTSYSLSYAGIEKIKKNNPERLPDAWRALGFVDTLSHVHRLTMPVMLTGGKLDTTTPIDSIYSLFEKLPSTRSYTEMAGQPHGYTEPFLHLAKAWFGIYL